MRTQTIPAKKLVFVAAVALCRVSMFAQSPSGEATYRAYCGNCHGAQGEGARGPALAGARLPRASSDSVFLTIVQTGIPNTEMPASRLQDTEVQGILTWLKSLAPRRTTQDPQAIARGRQSFKGKGDCIRCHIVQGEGGRLGPELTSIGLRAGPDRLRAAMLDPAAELPNSFAQYRLVIPIPDNFVMVRLRTRDGRDIRGVRLDEDPFTIQVRDAADNLYSFAKADLAEIAREKGSPMPSYRGRLTDAELDDLVAYLLSLIGRP